MLHVQVITPDGTIHDGQADSVTIPTADGEITVLPHHIPLVSILVPGTVVIRSKEGEAIIAVTRGVVEVDGKSVRILADAADRVEELEEAAIEKAKADAEKLRSETRHDTEAFADATAILERELARLRTVRRHRSRSRTPRIGE